MNEPKQVLGTGTRIRTHSTLGSIVGLIVKTEYLSARRANAFAVIGGFVPGHGGDVYWARHDDSTVAVYGWPEFELVDDA